MILAKMAYLVKMAEMAINRQNRQTINKNSNEMAKGPFAKWRFRRFRRFHQPQIKKNLECMLASFLKRVLAEMAITR